MIKKILVMRVFGNILNVLNEGRLTLGTLQKLVCEMIFSDFKIRWMTNKDFSLLENYIRLFIFKIAGIYDYNQFIESYYSNLQFILN
jgi:hypothetical protein